MAAKTATRGILTVLNSDASGFDSRFEKLVQRRERQANEHEKQVRKIVDRVYEGGDEELLACIHK